MKKALQTCFIIQLNEYVNSIKNVFLYNEIEKNKWKCEKHYVHLINDNYERRTPSTEIIYSLLGLDGVYCAVNNDLILLIYTIIYDSDNSQPLSCLASSCDNVVNEYLKKFLIINNNNEKIKNAVEVFIRGMC